MFTGIYVQLCEPAVMSKTCEKCGNPIDSSGTCSVCLISLGISQGAEQSELDQKLAALPSIGDLNEHFPQLEITRLVGRGGMGAIYHARQTALDRDVALKIIAKEVAGDTAFIERFEREAKTLARLSHPHIVTIFDFGRTVDGQAYLIMEFVDGINLREAMTSGSVDREDSPDLIATICKALEYAHAKGVVHRDIKPENILLGEDGTVKVADFGIAKIIDNSISTPTLTATRQVLGSLHYLAPEHLESPNQVDHRVDLYALGVVFYELLTGQLPLGRYEPPSAVRPEVDHRLDAVVMKALSRQPSQRYQSAAELESDLQQIGGSHAPHPVAEGRPSSVHSKGASVPFSIETFAGLAKSVGLVRALPGELKIEHRLQDTIFGAAKTNTRTISLPVESITSLDFVPNVFKSKLVISTDSMSALDSLPGAESGRVEMKIKRADNEMALRVVRSLGFSPSKPYLVSALAGDSASDVVKLHSGWTTFGVFMIFCGVVNAGLLAIAEVFIADRLDDVELVAAAVAAGVLFGPIIVIQILSGLLCIVARPIGVARTAALASMLPLTPGWVLSFPIGVWAYRWLRHDALEAKASARLSPAHVETTDVSQSMFWSTTSLFIPESRWGRRLLAVGNATAGALAIAAFVTFKFGLYPTTMTYRIVDSQASADDVSDRISQRIGSVGSVTPNYSRRRWSDSEDELGPRRLSVSTMARNRDVIRSMLSIESSVQMVQLESSSGGQADSNPRQELDLDSESDGSGASTRNHESNSNNESKPNNQSDESSKSDRKLSVASGLQLPADMRTISTGLGTTVTSDSQRHVIESRYVSSVSINRETLTIHLSSEGQESLLDSMTVDADFAGLGLVVDGQLEAFATLDDVSGRKIAFVLSRESNTSADAIIAAIRGPALSTDLELLD